MSIYWPVDEIRRHFPALSRIHGTKTVAFFDGPAGSQVPQSVADAVSRYLLTTNSNRGAANATAVESDALLDSAHAALADFLKAGNPNTISFGANMTTITLAVSRALAKQWKPGDEIIVSRLDHDANVTPWMLAARDAGVTVRHIDLNPADWTINIEDFRAKLSGKTRLVAVGYASNATGTINPLEEIIRDARSVGALTYIDAVHYAPHGRIDVTALNCDFLVCSAYKFFGPHTGILYGRQSLLENIQPYKLRPSPNTLPGRWMTGTQNHEGIVGAMAAVDYLASLDCDEHSGRAENADPSRCARLDRVFDRIQAYEQSLSARFLEQVSQLKDIRVIGITNPAQLDQRVPTFSLVSTRHTVQHLAKALAQRGIFAWAGNHYALPFTEAADLEPGGTLRIGALHYNNAEEIDHTIQHLAEVIC